MRMKLKEEISAALESKYIMEVESLRLARDQAVEAAAAVPVVDEEALRREIESEVTARLRVAIASEMGEHYEAEFKVRNNLVHSLSVSSMLNI
jgi:hypothetical protein